MVRNYLVYFWTFNQVLDNNGSFGYVDKVDGALKVHILNNAED
jgi:hypothetical protein